MEFFKGPLGSHFNYITYIALENCLDYLRVVKLHKEEGKDKTPDKYKRLRYFLNAIESLNNIPEYFLHEYKASEKWEYKDLSVILGGIRSKHKILRDVEQIANAYKHCIRNNQKDIHANDLQSAIVTVEINSLSIEANFNFESIEDENIIGEALRFWGEYLKNPDKKTLLP